jgi:hypothetical protein
MLAISAQYDFSLASVLWHPQPFDGRGPDLRAAIAGIYHKTLSSEDPRFDGAYGYQFGVDLEYRMLSWLSTTLRSYGTYRNPSSRVLTNSSGTPLMNGQAVTVAGTLDHTGIGRYSTVTVTPGLIFRSDWQAPERIEVTYSRFFYSHFADANPNDPRDESVVTVGATVSF